MTSNKQKILFLITQFEYGGAQKIILELFTRIDRQKYVPFLGVLYDKNSFKSRIEERFQIHITDFNFKSTTRNPIFKFVGLLRGIFGLFRFLKHENIAILQTFSHFSNIIGALVGFAASVPVRVTSQRMSLDHLPFFVKAMDSLIESSFLVSRLVSVSDGTARSCIQHQKIPLRKIVTIINGIDISEVDNKLVKVDLQDVKRRFQCQEGMIYFGTLARLHRQKGHQFLIEAVRLIAPDLKNARFLFFGDGALKAELLQTIEDYGLNEIIHIHPPISDIYSVYSAIDVFVLPSLWEGFPNSVLEAMAAAKPVICTNVDGAPEAVENGETGFLVPPKNPEALAHAIRQLGLNPALRASMGEKGRKLVERVFPISHTVRGFERLYEELSK